MKTLITIFALLSFSNSTIALTLSETDSLAAWEQAALADRIVLLSTLGKKLNKPGNIEPRRSDLRFLSICMNASVPDMPKETSIIDVFKLCWESGHLDKELSPEQIKKNQQETENLRNILKTSEGPTQEGRRDSE